MYEAWKVLETSVIVLKHVLILYWLHGDTIEVVSIEDLQCCALSVNELVAFLCFMHCMYVNVRKQLRMYIVLTLLPGCYGYIDASYHISGRLCAHVTIKCLYIIYLLYILYAIFIKINYS